jgi:hypothetical protein
MKIAQTPVMSVVCFSANNGSLDVHLPGLIVDNRHHIEGQSAQTKVSKMKKAPHLQHSIENKH